MYRRSLSLACLLRPSLLQCKAGRWRPSLRQQGASAIWRTSPWRSWRLMPLLATRSCVRTCCANLAASGVGSSAASISTSWCRCSSYRLPAGPASTCCPGCSASRRFCVWGGYFTNMVQSIFAVVSHRLVVLDVRLHGRPPASAQGFSQEVCSYVNRWRTQPRARSQREPEGEAPVARGAFGQLAELLNGPWYEASMVHYCDGRRP